MRARATERSDGAVDRRSTQSRSRRVVRFLATFVVVLGVALVAWRAIGDVYAAGFRAVGGVVVRAIVDGDRMSIVPVSPPSRAEPKLDSAIQVVSERRGSEVVSMKCGSWHVGYLPTAVFLAFALATPARTSRRWRGLIAGLLVVQLFVAMRLVLLATIVLPAESVPPILLQPFAQSVFAEITEIATRDVASLVVPVVVWVVVWREELARFVRPSSIA